MALSPLNFSPKNWRFRHSIVLQKMAFQPFNCFVKNWCSRCSIVLQKIAVFASHFFRQKNWHFCHSIVFYNQKLAFSPFNCLQHKIGMVAIHLFTTKKLALS
jgi:hypothetical protein